MTRISYFLFILIGMNIFSCTDGRNYYVSTSGSDKGTGSLEYPFRTIAYAAAQMNPGDTCFIRGGRYDEKLDLYQMKGSRDKPFVFTSYAGEEVIMDGSIAIKRKWEHLNGNIYFTRLSTPVWQLFIDDLSASSARWPNGNWIDGSIWDKSKSMCWPEKGRGKNGELYSKDLEALDFSLENGGIMIVNSGSFKTYKAVVTGHVAGSDRIVYDTSETRVHFSYRDHPERFGFFLEGKKELIDVENEWFFDPADSLLYVYFQERTSPEDHEIRGKVLDYSISGKNCNYVQIKGIDFFASTVRFLNSDNITLEDGHFRYPSYSTRMLGDLSPVHVTQLLVHDENTPANNIVRNCIFEYMDGPALEMNGRDNLVENCYMHHVDYSCTYNGGYTLNMIDATDLIFRRNTIHTTGTSEAFKAGRRNLIELNDISQTGFLQNDGALIQVSVKQQDQSVTRYNWVHNSVKQGLRFDNSNLPNSPYGQNGTMDHNVAWKTDRTFFKGDHHYIFNNLVFDSKLNDLVISSDTTIQGWNYSTITRNNICNKFSASRTEPGARFPVPGIVDHNWDGASRNMDVRSQLRDPDNLDFRPKSGSDLVDAGAEIKGKDIPFIGNAPDIGPYEYGDSCYRIPGFMAKTASVPVPPDGGQNVKTDADLMWLGAYRINHHEVYFGENPEQLENADRSDKAFKGVFRDFRNIYTPQNLESGRTYYWRVDAVTVDGSVIKGPVWHFTVE